MTQARGFTLMEVLLATALLAAGMALAFTTLRTATGSVARAELRAGQTEQVRTAQRFVRRQVSQALPMAFERDPDGGMAWQLLGEPERLVFVANMPGWVSAGGPHLQVLELVPDDDRGREGFRLQLTYRMLLGDALLAEDDGRPPVVLVDGIAEGVFEYRGMGPDGEISDWITTWDQSMNMPLMVRLDLAFIDPGRYWPPLAMSLDLREARQELDVLGSAPDTRRRR